MCLVKLVSWSIQESRSEQFLSTWVLWNLKEFKTNDCHFQIRKLRYLTAGTGQPLGEIARDEWEKQFKLKLKDIERTMFSANRSSNRTSKPTSLQSVEIFEAICLIIFIITSLLLNISICTVIWRSKLLRKRTTNIFIVNLAISNSLIALFIMPFSCRAVIVQVWDYGHVFCTVSSWNLYIEYLIFICT